MKKAELLAEQERLHALANELARKHWGVDYTGAVRLVPRKWKARLAAFAYKADDPSVHEIRMSAPTNAEMTAEEIADSLLHELVHWRLFTLGLPFLDTDDEFIAECLRVGAGLSGSGRAQDAYQSYLKRREFDEAV